MKTIRFSKGFTASVIASSAVILFGLFGLVFKGFNMGVDFGAGLNETVRLAQPAMSVSYSGEGQAEIKVAQNAMTIVVSGTKADDKTVAFAYDQYKTLGELQAALGGVKGVSSTLAADAGIATSAIIPAEQSDTKLGANGENGYIVHRVPANDAEKAGSVEAVRKALSAFGEVAVQIVGNKADQKYSIRIEDNGKDAEFSKRVTGDVRAALNSAFGADSIIVVSSDFVGARFSQNLGRDASLIVIAALFAIFIYATIRFKPQYAIGAVLAIVHDALIMVTFIVWTRMEFNTSTIAAILTILGYSVNDTIVIFDRIRENRKLSPGMAYRDLIDKSLTETLSRTIITALATFFCVLSLFVFTKGSMQDFALALIVGMISGTYSTIYIASAFVTLWEDGKLRREKKEQEKHGMGKGHAADIAKAKPAKA